MKDFFKRLYEMTYYKPSNFDKEKCIVFEKNKFAEYLDFLNSQDKVKLLLRGIKTKDLKSKLVTKLNSNNSLLNGLFLVGEKAKNYLEKAEDIPHQIKVIDSMGIDVSNWIFEEYSNLPVEIIKTDYFKKETNQNSFVNTIKNDRNLIDYYLVGLHKWNNGYWLILCLLQQVQTKH